jgi:hypothetical protein
VAEGAFFVALKEAADKRQDVIVDNHGRLQQAKRETKQRRRYYLKLLCAG